MRLVPRLSPTHAHEKMRERKDRENPVNYHVMVNTTPQSCSNTERGVASTIM